MANGATAGSVAGAAAAGAAMQIARAVKASGAIVEVASRDFVDILDRISEPLVVCAQYGWFSTKYQYLTAHKGLIFYTKSVIPLELPETAETIPAEKIWVPD